MRRSLPHIDPHPRRGTLAPAMLFALLVVGSAMALVVNRLWVDQAELELSKAAQSAALAAAIRLVDDDLLRSDADPTTRIDAARQQAVDIARQNFAAGRPVSLDPTPDGDVRFGRMIHSASADRPKFIETDAHPTTVVVFAQRRRRQGNPLPLLMATGRQSHHTDAYAVAEATIDNRVIGVRPLDGAAAPVLPVMILTDDPASSWPADQRTTVDRFGYRRDRRLVFPQADGIPEQTLTFPQPWADDDTGNSSDAPGACFVDLGNQLLPSVISEQCHTGINGDQLGAFVGELRFDRGDVDMAGSFTIDREVIDALKSLTGQRRICLTGTRSKTDDDGLQVSATGIVAVRIMQVRSDNETVEIIIQPTVMTTRTALLADPTSDVINPYIYNLSLTR